MILALHDPRPDDMAELARQTAVELRKRGIRTRLAMVGPSVVVMQSGDGYCFYSSDFDNLGPVACADVIQAEEARRAQEWAGDEP